jgi:CBS domain containing-hemolysin-like protein
MDAELLLKLAAVVVLIAANAYFVAVEFALVSARRSRIKELVDRGDRLARIVENAQENIDRSVSGAQLGITVASLGLGWIGEMAIADTLRRVFVGWPSPWSSIATHTTAIVIAFSLITFLHVVLGEQVPKMVAIIRPVKVARLTAPADQRLVQPRLADAAHARHRCASHRAQPRRDTDPASGQLARGSRRAG